MEERRRRLEEGPHQPQDWIERGYRGGRRRSEISTIDDDATAAEIPTYTQKRKKAAKLRRVIHEGYLFVQVIVPDANVYLVMSA